jgi:transcriptional regulator with XRE-family HTH domain
MDLRRLRKTGGWSQTQLELASGIPRWKISAFESGYTQPTAEEMLAIKKALLELSQRRERELQGALLVQQDSAPAAEELSA